MEFKLEQLTQTCQLLVTENARLSSFLSLLLVNNRLPSISNSEWPTTASYNGTIFTSPHQPLYSVSNGGLFPSTPFHPPENTNNLSVQSLVPPPTPSMNIQHSLSLEKALDQVQVLTTILTDGLVYYCFTIRNLFVSTYIHYDKQRE